MDIAGYTVIEPLGQDTASIVYLARRENLKARYAIRILTEAAAADGESKRSFLSGAKLAADITHPGLVKIHQFGEHEGKPFCVMDFICGSTLASKYRGMCLLDKIYVVKEAALALEYVAKFKLTHGQINLANIFIREADSSVVLTGFGFDPATISLSDRWSAIPASAAAFMSLEQLEGNELTPGSDIYSLGIVLYTLLEGEEPYQANSIEELRDRVAAGRVPEFGAGHAIFKPILERMLAVDPDDRYGGMSDFIADIGKISDEEILMADHIPVEPPAVSQDPVLGATGSGAADPQSGGNAPAAELPDAEAFDAELPITEAEHESAKVISLARRINATTQGEQDEESESELSRLLQDYPELAAEEDLPQDTPGAGGDSGDHPRTARERAEHWRQAALAQAVNHPQLADSSGHELPVTEAGGRSTADGRVDAPPEPRLHDRSSEPQGARTPGAADRGRVSSTRAGRSATTGTGQNPRRPHAREATAVATGQTAPTARARVAGSGTQANARYEALNHNPYRKSVAHARLGRHRGKPQAHPLRVLALAMSLLITVTIFLLPHSAQMQLYQGLIEPARTYLKTSLASAVDWLKGTGG